ncbi:MAG TPA: LacI family transcriptional regulator [Rhodobacteraceae bacterium]|jgi:LacI family transcriptional regulator|nr:LacI family transcriptional regulator [Paracoccaceae bacterium]|tara:strand:- start:1254 stop:2327 length:1074 start_codon:yes stop_codon:yes gene_type:complete
MKQKIKRPTITDIAERAGVGIATVDRVLSGRRKVREENVRRVFEAAAELGYHATPVIKYRLQQHVSNATFGFLLPKKNQNFYRNLTAALQMESESFPHLNVSVRFHYLETQDPSEHAECLRALGREVDVIAASTVDHSLVDSSVSDLAKQGIPVFAFLNDFSSSIRRKFIGLDNYRAGRQAAWMFSNTTRKPGTVTILVGSQLWQAHQQREMGLRSFFRQSAPSFNVRDAVLNLEARKITYDMVKDIVASQEDLTGIYVAGGGGEGAINALRDSGAAGHIRLILHPITEETRNALDEGIVTMIIGTPIDRLSRHLIAEMAAFILKHGDQPESQILLSPEILIPDQAQNRGFLHTDFG